MASSEEKKAEIIDLTAKKMNAFTRKDLPDVYESIKGNEEDLLVKAINERSWDLCTDVFKFAAYRVSQKKAEKVLGINIHESLKEQTT